MKQVIMILLAGALLTACNNDDDANEPENANSILHKWQLIEQLSDPGDGSGTFQPVTSQKTVEFFSNGTVACNGSLCSMDANVGTGPGTTGTYDDTTNEISPDNCMFAPPFAMSYSVNGNILIISYPCIEPCQEKYEKLP